MKKLTSATPHEASPTTSTNAPNRDLYSCFTFVTQQTLKSPRHSSSSFFVPSFLPHLCLGWGGGANHFSFGVCLYYL